MEKSKIDKIIGIFRKHLVIKEEGSPTMSVGTGDVSLGFNLKNGTPPVDLRRRKSRNWNPFFKELARIQRRKYPNNK
jgi:hypothetical protein